MNLGKFVALVLALLAFLFVIGALHGCTPNLARPAAYGAELEECSRKATACAESIACENRVRVRYGRQLRTGDCSQ